MLNNENRIRLCIRMLATDLFSSVDRPGAPKPYSSVVVMRTEIVDNLL